VKKHFEALIEHDRLKRVMFDPLSYIHPRRLKTPSCFDTPRHRAVLNRIILDNLMIAPERSTIQVSLRQGRLLRHWLNVPQVSTLIGAQLLKSDLAWRGSLLRLSASVRAFLGMPFHRLIDTAPAFSLNPKRLPDQFSLSSSETCNIFYQIQRVGLTCMLDWQRTASSDLLCRLRLMFAPELDAVFDQPRRQLDDGELFLISQALQYAKNHSNHA